MTITQRVDFLLPSPWSNGKRFTKNSWPSVTFAVGPNGTGKSRWADSLRNAIGAGQCRLLGADRLDGTSHRAGGQAAWFSSQQSAEGFMKGYFSNYINTAQSEGFGSDAFILLEQNMDLRIRIEAVLSQVFERDIELVWDSGALKPMAYHAGSGAKYRLHRDECHGLKELVVLLTHLYSDKHRWLIIDEPELNLHPQYQSYLMSHVRAVAGDPNRGGKGIVLVTHSPTILDLTTADSLRSVICFHADMREPSWIRDEIDLTGMDSLVSRLNSHHKQLFFAHDPVFVEGHHDLRFFNAVQAARGVNMEAAGSGFLDVGGKDELVFYYRLAECLGKQAHFILDLDALFEGLMRQEVRRDERVVQRLLATGLGRDLQAYIGQLENALRPLIEASEAYGGTDEVLLDLKLALAGCLHDGKRNWPKSRYVMAVACVNQATAMQRLVGKDALTDAVSRLRVVLDCLELHRHLPAAPQRRRWWDPPLRSVLGL